MTYSTNKEEDDKFNQELEALKQTLDKAVYEVIINMSDGDLLALIKDAQQELAQRLQQAQLDLLTITVSQAQKASFHFKNYYDKTTTI
jgi:hypothetical protein